MLRIQYISVRQYEGTVAVALIPLEEDIKFMAGMKTSAVFIPLNVAVSRLCSVVQEGKTYSLS